MGYKTIAGQIPTFQALGLAGAAYPKRRRKVKRKKKPLRTTIGKTAKILVGLPIMKTTAGLVKGL